MYKHCTYREDVINQNKQILDGVVLAYVSDQVKEHISTKLRLLVRQLFLTTLIQVHNEVMVTLRDHLWPDKRQLFRLYYVSEKKLKYCMWESILTADKTASWSEFGGYHLLGFARRWWQQSYLKYMAWIFNVAELNDHQTNKTVLQERYTYRFFHHLATALAGLHFHPQS